MEDIEVNEYVRTSKGIIFQATKNIKINVNIPKKYKKIVDPITKHSFNLIDLLEVRRLCKWKISSSCRL